MSKFDTQVQIEELFNEAAEELFAAAGEFGDPVVLAEGLCKCEQCGWEIPKEQAVVLIDEVLCGFCASNKN